jgi:hypothetical protein
MQISLQDKIGGTEIIIELGIYLTKCGIVNPFICG